MVSVVSPDWLTPTTKVVRVEHRVAVAELARDVDLDWQPGPVLDRVLGDEAGVIAGAATDDEHLVDRTELVVGQAHLVEVEATVGQEPIAQRLADRLRLLVDLLEHEVGIAALLCLFEMPSRRPAASARPPHRRTC